MQSERHQREATKHVQLICTASMLSSMAATGYRGAAVHPYLVAPKAKARRGV